MLPQYDDIAISQDFGDLNINNHGMNFDFLNEPPPPPMISSEGIVALDITQEFRSAAANLEPGELVKDGYFTLFESVGALEIMDSKMDSGCLAPGESLDDDYDVSQTLLPSEVLGIIDQLLSLEMAWHLGYPLSQTVFTSVYIDKMLEPAPTTIGEADFIRGHPAESPRDPLLAVLRAYCLGLVKSCCYVNERIKMEHYYEEEDFVTNTYHRSLLDNIDLNEIGDEIVEARKELHGLKDTISEEIADALGLRLELRTAFLQAIELSELRSNPELLSQPWSQLQGVWEAIKKTRHLGKPVPEAFSTKIQRRLASTMPPRPIVQLSAEETHGHFKKLFEDAINVLNVLNYSDSQSLLNFVMTFQAQKPQPLVYIRTLLQNFLFHDMVILGRLSIRQLMDDDLSIVVLPHSILLDPANDAIEAPHHPRYAIAHHMELFRQRAAQSYLDIFRAFCQNRCRVRRTLFHSLQDWETIQIDAEELDQLLQSYTGEKPLVYPPSSGAAPAHSLPLSSWAYQYKLRLMEWIVQLGFELEIYQPDELAGMYWYLSYLSRTRAQHAERIRFFSSHSLPSSQTPSSPPLSQPISSPTTQRTLTLHHSHTHLTTLLSATTSSLSTALSNIYTALARLHLLPTPLRPYGSDILRHELRMRPFAPIGLPPLPGYEEFVRDVTQPDVSIQKLLDEAGRMAGIAKRGLEALGRVKREGSFTGGGIRSASGVGGTETGTGTGTGKGIEGSGSEGGSNGWCYQRWSMDIKNALKAAIAVGVAVENVKRAVDRSKSDRKEKAEGEEGLGLKVEVPKPEQGYHEWWIVPRVVEQK